MEWDKFVLFSCVFSVRGSAQNDESDPIGVIPAPSTQPEVAPTLSAKSSKPQKTVTTNTSRMVNRTKTSDDRLLPVCPPRRCGTWPIEWQTFPWSAWKLWTSLSILAATHRKFWGARRLCWLRSCSRWNSPRRCRSRNRNNWCWTVDGSGQRYTTYVSASDKIIFSRLRVQFSSVGFENRLVRLSNYWKKKLYLSIHIVAVCTSFWKIKKIRVVTNSAITSPVFRELLWIKSRLWVGGIFRKVWKRLRTGFL